MTPIQQVQAVAAAINGGNLYNPYIVKEITDDKGKDIQSFDPEMKRQVISEETSKASEGSARIGSCKWFRP